MHASGGILGYILESFLGICSFASETWVGRHVGERASGIRVAADTLFLPFFVAEVSQDLSGLCFGGAL